MPNRAIALLLYLGSLGMLGVILLIEYGFGHSLAEDAKQAWLHMGIGVFGLLSIWTSGSLVAHPGWGYKAGGAFAGMFALFFAAFTFVNIAGYSASKPLQRNAAAEKNVAIKKESFDKQVEFRAGTTQWMKQQTIRGKNTNRADRRAALKAIQEMATSGPIAGYKVTAEEAMPDPQAAAVAMMFGVSIDWARMGISGYAAIAAILAELFGGFFAPILWSLDRSTVKKSLRGQVVEIKKAIYTPLRLAPPEHPVKKWGKKLPKEQHNLTKLFDQYSEEAKLHKWPIPRKPDFAILIKGCGFMKNPRRKGYYMPKPT